MFALASPKPKVHVYRHSPSDEYDNIIYDIWIAGITPNVLRPIDASLQDTWEAVLQASHSWKRLFDATGLDARDMRMSMDAASAEDNGHWNWWFENVAV